MVTSSWVGLCPGEEGRALVLGKRLGLLSWGRG